jgi:hypothetical protein
MEFLFSTTRLRCDFICRITFFVKVGGVMVAKTKYVGRFGRKEKK